MKGTKWMVFLCATTVACGMTVNAAPFDAAYYAAQNPDVVEAIGNDAAVLEAHYNAFGMAEGRMGNAEDEGSKGDSAETGNISAIFDAEYYAAHNPDVVAAVGTDPMALYMHFITTGVNEGRFGNATFNAAAYKAANPDLADTLGSDLAAYANHYMTVGQNEGRSAGVSSGSNGAESNTSGSSSQEEDPYARFNTSGSTSTKHSKSSGSEKTEENESNQVTYEPFTDYTVNGITGPDSLQIGEKGTYDISYTINEAAIPAGFEYYAAIDDLLINGHSIIDNKGQSTDDRVEIEEWGAGGSLSFTVTDDIGGSITVYAVFNVRQEGCTGRDDPNNINLALVEPTKTVTITAGAQTSNLCSNIMVAGSDVQDDSEQESVTVVLGSSTDTQKADTISASEEDNKESEEEMKEDSEEELEEETEEELEAESEE